MYTLGIEGWSSTYGKTELLIGTNKMCEKHCQKNDILSNDADPNERAQTIFKRKTH